MMVFIMSCLFLISFFGSVLVFMKKSIFMLEWDLFFLSGKSIEFLLLVDIYSLMFFASVMLISLSVMTFSYSYMSTDILMTRFHMILSSFIFSMVLLIFSPNMISVLIGWDGLGMSSYLLVVYYSSEKSFKAGMITALTNRVGDAFLIMYIGMIYYLSSLTSSVVDILEDKNYYILMIIFVVAATTKSAQIPFSAWLPAAMAAPTPVSALVHSSTLVTAGVYLLFRFNSFFLNKISSTYLLWVGGMTMLLASMSAMSEMDMKKMVALSTLSQLGVMILSLGSNLIVLGYLHLLAHAFFKALLFLSTGSLIHACGSYQDMRMAGSLMEVMPLSSSMMLVCMFSLMGMPFMVSFYSKETIIESMLLMDLGFIPWLMMILGICLTGIYSMRMLFLVTLSMSNQPTLHFKTDNDSLVNVSMFILLIPAMMGGVLLNNMFFKTYSYISSSLGEKMMMYTMLVVSMIVIFLTNKINYISYKTPQWVWTNMWNLPTFSGVFPVMLASFNGMKLQFLVDYSWSYSLVSYKIMESGSLMSYSSLMFNSMKFSRLISLSILFVFLLFFM